MFSKSSRGRPENVLGTSRSNVLGTPRINLHGTSCGRHFETSRGRQIGTSRGWSNRIFWGRPGDVGGGCSRGVLGTNICRLGTLIFPCSRKLKSTKLSQILNLKLKDTNFSIVTGLNMRVVSCFIWRTILLIDNLILIFCRII